ncbi:oxygen-independent coproporphyrinogen III oxidase [Sphingosinicella rhizophila]|uniref:Coproporphyrinogen-III oxidase n=1 Tax=Sphingosinicella rhizophila TaxID=3050082 RepID=A0ABU3Q918_9SPHN|nr:oxygen-independent coproporphyrinogen III oxidase [Sphingosinicella sp. GR2756]MDT9599903.1 oxygen-independent coproporphyrinogen III oxidase [Sphingosinicella sp. GR2756]
MKPETLTRYGSRTVPRYTSYPTAPHFSPKVGEALYRWWLSGLVRHVDISLYLHVPFCRSMCWYCGCHTTVTARREPVERYLTALQREAELVAAAAPRRLRLSHLHFGGGTPTLMEPAQMTSLMARLRDCFDFAATAEIAIEVDPRTLSAEMAAALGGSGFNRASLGVQSFDPEVQSAINRIQSFEETFAATEALRLNGVAGMNFDLIYGLPRQTVASCLDTVDKALRLEPDRFAVFGYAHVPSFKRHQRRIDAAALPGTAERLAQSRAIAEALIAAGYVQVGLDHFAKPGDSLAEAAGAGRLHRNFQGYTTDAAEALIGLGASAIGRLPGGYVQNAVLISEYEKRVAAGQLPITRGRAISSEDRLRGRIIERIMCDYEVDVGALCASPGLNPRMLLDEAKLEELLRDGIIERSGTRLKVKAEARPLVRSVAAAFDAYLAGSEERHARAV